MRSLAITLLLLGVVLLGGGLFFGCGFYAEWNGRNVLVERPITLGSATAADVDAKEGHRYTFSARVVVDRRDVSPEDAARGASALELEMPWSMRLVDGGGQRVLEQAGFLSHEPPTSVYGDAMGGATGRGAHALVAERFLGPYPNAAPQKLHVDLDLGEDRRGVAKVADARLVVYDDALPRRIVVPFIAAGGGVVLILASLVLGIVGLTRRYVRGAAGRAEKA